MLWVERVRVLTHKDIVKETFKYVKKNLRLALSDSDTEE